MCKTYHISDSLEDQASHTFIVEIIQTHSRFFMVSAKDEAEAVSAMNDLSPAAIELPSTRSQEVSVKPLLQRNW